MSATQTIATDRALAREWLAARVVIFGGFAVAIVAAIYFGVIVPKYIAPREMRAALVARVQTLLTQEAQVCTAALATAKNFGIVPQYGKLATAQLEQTNVQGRYACLARTPASKYVLVVDLVCRNFKEARCISLYNVSQTDGTILYQRQR